MPRLSPPILTHGEQKAILRASRRNLRDYLIYSLALGTGLRLAEIEGLNVGDVYTPEGKPKNRIRLRPGRQERPGRRCLPAGRYAGQVPEVLAAQGHEARGATARRSALLLAEPLPYLTLACPIRLPDLAGAGRVRSAIPLPCTQAHGGHERLQAIEGPVPGAEICEACQPADDGRVHAPQRRGTLQSDSQPGLLTIRVQSSAFRSQRLL